MAIKILHFADVHARDNDIAEIRKCLDFLTRVAGDRNPDLIICAGDVFHSANVKLDSQATKMVFEVFARLGDIAPVAVIAGTPSHEGHATDVLNHLGSAFKIHVTSHPEQISLGNHGSLLQQGDILEPGEEPRAIVTMVPAPTKQYFQTDNDIKGADSEIAAAMSAMFAGFAAKAGQFDCPHILVGHWNTTGSLVSETQTLTGVDIELSRDQMALAGADLVCLGHIHKAQKIEPNIFYSGSTQSNTWGELDPKGFYFHTIYGPDDIKSEFIETPSLKMIRLSHDFTQGDGFKDLDMVLYTYSDDVINGAVIRLDIKAYQDEVEKIDKKKIEEFFDGAGALGTIIQTIRIPRVNVRSKRLLDMESLRDKLIERAALNDNQEVRESILDKADQLDAELPEKIIERI